MQTKRHSPRCDSPAWLLRGISTIPGRLRLRERRLSFLATDSGSAWNWQLEKLDAVADDSGFSQMLLAGEHALLFDAPLERLGFRVPWYYFKGGLIVIRSGQRFRFSFGPPAQPRGAGLGNLDGAAEGIGAIIEMRRTGKRWLRLLGLDGNPAGAAGFNSGA